MVCEYEESSLGATTSASIGYEYVPTRVVRVVLICMNCFVNQNIVMGLPLAALLPANSSYI